MPSVDFTRENLYGIGPIDGDGEGLAYWDFYENGTQYYAAPSMEISRVFTLSMLSRTGPLEPLGLCSGGTGCSYVVQFYGPAYNCEKQDECPSGFPITMDEIAPKGKYLYHAFSDPEDEDSGRPSQWSTSNSTLGTFTNEPVFWAGFAIGSNEDINWTTVPPMVGSSLIKCSLYNASYGYNITVSNGVARTRRTELDLLALINTGNRSIFPSDPDYASYA